VIVVALCIMTNECDLTLDYDLIVSLGKGLFQIDIYDCLSIGNMWLTCMSSCKKYAW